MAEDHPTQSTDHSKGPVNQRDYDQERYKRLTDAGLCISCQGPSRVGKTRCAECTTRYDKSRRARAAERRQNGLCPVCARPAAPGKMRCVICIKTAKDRCDSRVAAGLCWHCENPQMPGKRLCQKHYEAIRASGERTQQKLRAEVFAAYGGFRCACCGETTPEFLTVDHIEGGGNQHRKQLAAEGITLYRWLKRHGFPPGFQALCANCNTAKHIHGQCPHQRGPH